ncbi:MAG: hypothetical protein Q7R33_00985 [Nitrosarchaeum sp.]|nr:hypothetical protein [Nitrosarchaeum sp.]
MGTSTGNFKRKLNGFYDDKNRRLAWSQARSNTNKKQAIIHLEFTKKQLTELSIDSQWFEQQLSQYRISVISKTLKSLGIKHTKLAIKQLKQQIDKSTIKDIAKEKRRTKTSNTLKIRLATDVDLKLRYVKNLSKRCNHKYRSKGELRLKHWLQETYPSYNWKSKHLVYNSQIYEFDIYSKEFDDYFIEYNGICHYKQLHSKQNFERIQERDTLKVQIMKDLHKKFLVVKDNNTTFDLQKKAVIEFFNLNNSCSNGGEGTHNLQLSL